MGPFTVTPDGACAALVNVELRDDAADAEVDDAPQATRTVHRLKTAATPRVMRPCPRLLRASRPTVAPDVMTSPLVGTARQSQVTCDVPTADSPCHRLDVPFARNRTVTGPCDPGNRDVSAPPLIG